MMEHSQKDRLIRATGAHVPFRLVLADITHSAEEVGKMHGASSEALKLLAETSIASLFLSSSLNFPGPPCLPASPSGATPFA